MNQRIGFLLGLAVALTALPARALDTIYLVRHAEKAEGWPKDRAISALQPLSPAGVERSERLAELMREKDIAAIYASPTTRTLATGLPLARALKCPIQADERSIRVETIPAFLKDLRDAHQEDAAVLVVGHSNTVPMLLEALGGSEQCWERLGVAPQSWGPGIEGYEGLWRIDLKASGCWALARLPHP